MTGDSDDVVDPLRARLRIEPHEAAGCAVLAAGDRGADVVQSDTCLGDDHGNCSCRAAVTVEAEGDQSREFVQSDVSEYCVCPAFREVDCVAEIEGFEGGALRVVVTVPERDAIRELVAALREREATVHLEQVLPASATGDGQTMHLDASAVTAKQREAIATAMDLGYYERPRGADLQDVADALGVSRSAASQRLTAAETTLVQALVESTDLTYEEADAQEGASTPGVRPDPAAGESVAD